MPADRRATMLYQPRFYRNWVSSDLVSFAVKDGQTDIFISAEKNLRDDAERLVKRYRAHIADYIEKNPQFEKSLAPLPEDKRAPEIIKAMLRASAAVGVGPMAAVAGAISEFVGRELLKLTRQVILENGGDLFIKTDKARNIGIYAGNSPLSGKIAIKIKPGSEPLGLCTSSGTVGHSLSFGNADAVSVIAASASLADACATAACNMVRKKEDIEKALSFAKNVEGVVGCVVIYKDNMGTIGDVQFSEGVV